MLYSIKLRLFATKEWFLHCINILLDLRGYFSYLCFLRNMNDTALALRLVHTVFHNPSGATKKSRTTPKDLLTLGNVAISQKIITESWTLDRCDIHVFGPHARMLQISNNVIKSGKPVMGHYLIGGKSGSWETNHRALLLSCLTSKGELLATIFANDRYSFDHIYEIGLDLCKSLEGKKETPFLTHLVKHGGGYAGLLTHTGNYVFQKNEDHVYLPASTTKVMTALIALKANPSQAGTIMIHPLDIMSGSGSKFFPGDMLSFQDALRVMIMESSNTMANAIARTVGSLPHSKDTV